MAARGLNIRIRSRAIRSVVFFIMWEGLVGTALAADETSVGLDGRQPPPASKPEVPNRGSKESEGNDRQAKEYLETILYTRKEVGDWISGRVLPYAKTYDNLLGWVHADSLIRDGIDGSIVTYTHPGPRRMIMYADKTCRINTYGNSFTHCDQVSDGETWQEILAAHLCEPIRNFGITGFSVYQAYLRMKKEETRTPAEYIIFNIYEDDHNRNLDSWTNIRGGDIRETRSGLRNYTQPHVRVNPSTGEFLEFRNPCPTRQSVFNLSDPNWLHETFKDDFVLKLVLARLDIRNNTPEKSYAKITDLAQQHGMEAQIDSIETLRQTVNTLHIGAGLFATMQIVENIEEYAAAHGKKVLYVLSYGMRTVADSVRGQDRFDREFIEFLERRQLPYVDLLEAHLGDFATFNMGIEEYLDRYWVSHYNPRGNFFTAFSAKDRLVDMLQPKPVPYDFDSTLFIDP